MDFAKFVEAINQLLAVIKPGLSLPEDVSEESFGSVFAMVLKMVGAEESAEDDGSAEDAGDITDTSADESVSMSLKSLTKEVALLKAKLGVSLSLAGSSAKDRFAKEVDAMVNAGFPAANKSALLNVGKAGGWNTSDLDEFKSMAGVSLGLKSTGVKLSDTSDRAVAAKAWRAAGLSEQAVKRQTVRLFGGDE